MVLLQPEGSVKQLLAVHANDVADKAIVETVRLDVDRGARHAAIIAVGLKTIAVSWIRMCIAIERRVRGAIARNPIAERRDVNRIAPIPVSLEVLAVVAFQQLQMRRRIMARVDPRLRLSGYSLPKASSV